MRLTLSGSFTQSRSALRSVLLKSRSHRVDSRFAVRLSKGVYNSPLSLEPPATSTQLPVLSLNL